MVASSRAPTLLLALLGVVLACSGSERAQRRTEPSPTLPADVRLAYVSEDPPELRRLLAQRLLRADLRESLELSTVLNEGRCRTAELSAAVEQHPTWVSLVELGHCVALQGRERDALERFVQAVDLARDPSEVDYVVRRVCRAADQTELTQIDAMCVGGDEVE